MNLTNDMCEPGKFLDTLAPDVVRRAECVDATKPVPRTGGMDGLAPVILQMESALMVAESWLCLGDRYELQMADECHKALAALNAWRAAK